MTSCTDGQSQKAFTLCANTDLWPKEAASLSKPMRREEPAATMMAAMDMR
jgi:hypothetical protein